MKYIFVDFAANRVDNRVNIRNDQFCEIDIVYGVVNNGITIQSFGKSLKNAVQGETIRVQVNNWFNKNINTNSTEIIEAKVIAPNEVEYVGKQ